LALVRSTADPGKAGVVARHATARSTENAAGGQVLPGEIDEVTTGELEAPGADPVEQSHARRRAKAMADKAETDAKAAERDYRISIGELLEAGEVDRAVGAAVASFRGTLENLPSTLAPELSAMVDEGRVRVLLSEAFEHALEELSRQFASLARREEAA
jgi:alpha-galactosidase/6-phospho-beta-glucosidase family protein